MGQNPPIGRAGKTRKPAFAAGRYFKYAIGEILLVVIGILIALQINNWNEKRKSSENELALLNSLKSEMMTSLKGLEYDYESSVEFRQSTRNIYYYIQNKPKLVDSMNIDFYKSVQFDYSFPKTSTYETLKSGDLEIIKSDSLRMIITDIYEEDYERILKKVDTRRNAARLLFPYYQKNFRTILVKSDSLSRGRALGIPNNYNLLINDPEYETLIFEANTGRNMASSDLRRTIKDIENCIKQIDSYLEQ
tara:strand:- start:2750 stop:3496 length:747 start_codon:yes stop_codon:yes gene_type:complete